MNIDPNKVKELVLTFAELDEDYQTKLMNRARVLALKQSQEKAIHREGKKFENNLELEKEVEKRSNKRLDEVKEVVDIYDKLDDDDKAALTIIVNKLSKGKLTQKTDLTIQINEKSISMKAYLEEVLPKADFNEANKKAMKLLKETKSTHN